MQLEKARRDFPTPGHLARYIEKRTVTTPALDMLDAALVDTASSDPRLMWTMPPQEGKSVRVSRFFAHWLLIQNPHRRIAIVSYADALARRWGRAIRNDIIGHSELGLRISADTGAANEWQLDGYDGGVITAGIEAGLTGRPVDVLIIDDPLKGQKEADSETYRELCKDFWRTTASTRLGENSIVVIVMTRWHEDDLVGWLRTEQPARWRLINVPAQAEHDPDRGTECKCGGMVCAGDDVLGREPGEYMVSARGRTVEGWTIRKIDAGSRGWNALYQGRPSPQEGAVLKREWWKFYSTPRAMPKADGSMYAIGADQVLISLDAAFKDTDQSDYVVFGVWARRGAETWLLDIKRDRMDFPATIATFKQLCAKWPQASMKLVEDKANGPAVIATLAKEVPGMVPYSPIDSKLARAYSVSPFIEAGNVWLPDPVALDAPWVSDFVEECAGFPNATHDDQVDMTTQALIRLYLLGGGAADFMTELLAQQKTGHGERPMGATYWSTQTQ